MNKPKPRTLRDIYLMLTGLTCGNLVILVLLELSVNKRLEDPIKAGGFLEVFAGFCLVLFILWGTSYKILGYFTRRFHRKHPGRALFLLFVTASLIFTVYWGIISRHPQPEFEAGIIAFVVLLIPAAEVTVYVILLFRPITEPEEEEPEENAPRSKEQHFKTTEEGNLSPQQEANYLADVEQRRWRTRQWSARAYACLLIIVVVGTLLSFFGVHVPLIWQFSLGARILAFFVLLLVGGFSILLLLSMGDLYESWYREDTQLLEMPGFLWTLYVVPILTLGLTIAPFYGVNTILCLALGALLLVGAYFAVQRILVIFYFPTIEEYQRRYPKGE